MTGLPQWSPAKCAKSLTHLCPTLCDPMDYTPPGSSVPGISQARILEWVAISLLQEIFLTPDITWVSCHCKQSL